MTNHTPKPKKRTQHDRFIEAARQLDCDEDEKAFDEKLKKIAKATPKKDRVKGG
jgi:hypothetical protein